VFVDPTNISNLSWQAFERSVCRYLVHANYEGIRIVGGRGDKGADVIAHLSGKRWLFQAKHWKQKVGVTVIQETIAAAAEYRADIPVVISLNGFDDSARDQQLRLLGMKVPLQLWSGEDFCKKVAKLEAKISNTREPKPYQESAIRQVVKTFLDGVDPRALVVMATGLGKTFVAAESVRRIRENRKARVLVLAHTNELVYQLEKAFWQFMKPVEQSRVWNGAERPDVESTRGCDTIFGCINSVYEGVGGLLDEVAPDIVIVDECHHAGAAMYSKVLEEIGAGRSGGPFLLGLSATPWRPDEVDISKIFGPPSVCVDMVTGLKNGFLANVDYRMFTDNINWDALNTLHGTNFSPRQINRTLFISEWDDGVVRELESTWKEQKQPKAIVFCGTIDHAITMRDRINSLRFCNAEAIFSGSVVGAGMSMFQRNRVLCDFHDGKIDVVCAVDIFNEGVDVPDVNIVVFQRVTHSRRIFVQQLGRGLRWTSEKDKVIVLDFVSDIRRFAAGLALKSDLEGIPMQRGGSERISIPNKVTFRKAGGDDPESERFLRQWLEDVAEIEGAGEDASVLKFPPHLPGVK